MTNESRFLLSVHARNSRQLMRANETINKMRAAEGYSITVLCHISQCWFTEQNVLRFNKSNLSF